jgi:ubiquinone/menaquinone biosynthesis C-methylase UbiE
MNILDMNFPDASFDAIYAHLSLHYFSDEITDTIFQNVHRMLKAGGYFFVKCKSTIDPLCGKGEMLEKDMYFLDHQRHFFSKEYMKDKLGIFNVLSLEATSASYEGKISRFIEAIGQKT